VLNVGEVFEVGGGLYPLPERQASILAEQLRLFAKGNFPDDVRSLAAGERWIKGARPAADLIEDTLVERRLGPIPLEWKTADVVFQVLRVSHESRLGRALSKALPLGLSADLGIGRPGSAVAATIVCQAEAMNERRSRRMSRPNRSYSHAVPIIR
jgi:hypothetical protein